MGLLNWVVGILEICAPTLVTKKKETEFLITILVGILVILLVFHRRKFLLGWNPGRGATSASAQTSTSSGFEEQARQVNDSLYELYRPDGDPDVQVLFFHGLPFEDLFETHISTWLSEDGSCIWPKAWLAKDFPHAHILVASYSEGLREGSAESFDMRNIGENLFQDLMQANIGQIPYCPVVLVGHSFGGLVIKKLCVEAHHTRISPSNEAKVEKFLENLRGIFYYSTPHHGGDIIGKGAKVFRGSLLQYFKSLSTQAERLNYDFNRLHKSVGQKWQIEGLGEALAVKSGPFKGYIIVPEASARDGENFNLESAADHFSVCRPRNRISRRFYALTKLLHNVDEKLKEEKKIRDENREHEEAMALKRTVRQDLLAIPKHVIGLEFRLEELKTRLEKVTTLGLTGMGGVGKTTLAMVIFNAQCPAFEYSCFIHDVKLIQGGESDLKEVIWKHMHRDGRKVGDEEEWSDLSGKQLLLVLDDISGERDIAILSSIADHCSSIRSRFLVTSRDRDLLSGLNSRGDVYDVPFLDQKTSKELFQSHAFPNQLIRSPKVESVTEAIVKMSDGLPLTLTVLGRYLKTKRNIDDWEQTLSALDKAEAVKTLNEKLWAKLRLSYDGLEEKEQQIFLDSTTFFSGRENSSWTLREAKAAWREVYETSSERLLWQTLVDRCLVYDVQEDEAIQVHEQLQSMGRKIALEPSYYGQVRVWEKSLVVTLLQSANQMATKEFHALRLKEGDSDNGESDERQSDIEESSTGETQAWESVSDEDLELNDQEVIHIVRPALQRLKNLHFLELDASVVIDGLEEDESFFTKVVLLKCVGLQIFNPALQSRLAVLHLSCKDVRMLPKSIGQLSSLRILFLEDSELLDSLPDEIGRLSNLEALELKDCKSLQTLPKTFGKLLKLKNFCLGGCTALHDLPSSFGNLSSLQHLKLDYCYELHSLPKSFGYLSALEHLELTSLPESYGQLSTLLEPDLLYSDLHTLLPESFGQLSALKELKLWCDSLHTLPESFGQLSALKELKLSSSALHTLPESFGQLSALKHLDLSYSGLHTLPESFGQLSALKQLNLSWSYLHALPESFGHLSALEHLHFGRCHNVHALPLSFWELTALKNLSLCSSELKQLPESFGQLLALEYLHLDLPQLHGLPESLGQLKNLKYLRIGGSQEVEKLGLIEKLPDSLVDLIALRNLVIDRISIESIPYSIKNLQALHTLELNLLPYVKVLPRWLGDTGVAPLAVSRKIFQVQNGCFSLTGENYGESVESMVRLVHRTAMEEVRKSDYKRALAKLCPGNLGMVEPQLQGFLMQERGIARRLDGDLQGALEDLTTALGLFSQADDGHHYSYSCWKHRGFVRFLVGDLHGAQNDGEMALKLLPIYRGSRMSPSLGERPVTYMHFRLKGSTESGKLTGSLHFEVMEKVRVSDFLGALAIWGHFDEEESGYSDRAIFLQERGILKRFVGDLPGALADLAAALEINPDDYECSKHRGYVKYLLGDFDGARIDAKKCLVMGYKEPGDACLGAFPVAFMGFTL